MDFDIENGYELIIDKVENWITTFIEMLPNLVMALLILILFYVIGKLIRRAVNKLLNRVTDNKTIIHLLETVAGVMILSIGIFIALGILNLDGTVKSLLAGAGIVGLALGFAFQDIASNFISGIFLSVRHPFGIGDIIQSNGYYGTVQKLNLRNTILRTPQGQIIYLPNKKVFDSPMENFTKNGERRIDLVCGVSYGDDLEKAREVAIEAVKSIGSYNANRDVELFFTEFGGSSINFQIRFWVDFYNNNDFWTAQSDAIMAIKKNFEDNDIEIPFPIRTLDFGIKGGEKLNQMLGHNGNDPDS